MITVSSMSSVKAVALTAQPGIGAEDKFTAVKIPDHFRLQRLQGKLFDLVPGIQVKGKGDAVCIHEKIIVGAVVVKEF